MSQHYEKSEEAILLVAVGAFLFVSFASLVSILAKYPILAEQDLVLKFGLSVVSFILAVTCFQLAPNSQGRTLTKLAEILERAKASFQARGPLAVAKTSPEVQGLSETLGPLTAGDIVMLNRNVGSAGFFNRIGLTGIPLTVAVFALIFCGLAFLALRLGDEYERIFVACLELTKLTVGAFIGALTRNVSDDLSLKAK
jgi:hypothetical protein